MNQIIKWSTGIYHVWFTDVITLLCEVVVTRCDKCIVYLEICVVDLERPLAKGEDRLGNDFDKYLISHQR